MIDSYCFAEDEKNIVIPDGTDGISELGFKDCDYIESVYIPDSVKSIGCYAFEGCVALKKVRLPKGLKQLEHNVFAGCESLAEIVIPEGVEEIEKCAFQGCRSLESVSFPDTLVKIGAMAFSECQTLKEVILPDSVGEIGYSCFIGCYGLVRLRLPDGLKEIDEFAFARCCSLINVEIPDTVTRIRKFAFCECLSLVNVRFGRKVNIVESKAFQNCALEQLGMPSSVNHVAIGAFLMCEKLSEVFVDGVHTFFDADAMGSNVRIISPHICIKDWHKKYKLSVARGFAKGIADGVVFDEEVVEKNHRYIRSQRKKMCANAMDDIYFIRYLTQHCMLDPEDTERCMNAAQGNTELTALLLDYRNSFTKTQLETFDWDNYEL